MANRVDAFPLLGSAAWALGTLACVGAVVAFAVTSVFTQAMVATGVCAVGMVAALVVRAAIQSSAGRWPNWLASNAPPRRVRELHGVQVVTMPERVQVPAGARFEVEVLLQSCVAGQREVTFSLQPMAGFSAGREPVRVPEPTMVTLQPGEVYRVKLSCVAVSGAIGEHWYRVVPRVSGRGGSRERPWHAAPWRASPPMLLELLAVFSAFSLGTESEAVRVVVKSGQPGDEAMAPGAHVERVWAT